MRFNDTCIYDAFIHDACSHDACSHDAFIPVHVSMMLVSMMNVSMMYASMMCECVPMLDMRKMHCRRLIHVPMMKISIIFDLGVCMYDAYINDP